MDVAMRPTLPARINRAELGDFDAFIPGLLLVSMYPSQIIIRDPGFCTRGSWASLIRQNRLAVGLNAIAELNRKMPQVVLLMSGRSGRGCTYGDGKALAQSSGFVCGTNDFAKRTGKVTQ